MGIFPYIPIDIDEYITTINESLKTRKSCLRPLALNQKTQQKPAFKPK
jgi:hypothetical protein